MGLVGLVADLLIDLLVVNWVDWSDRLVTSVFPVSIYSCNSPESGERIKSGELCKLWVSTTSIAYADQRQLICDFSVDLCEPGEKKTTITNVRLNKPSNVTNFKFVAVKLQ